MSAMNAISNLVHIITNCVLLCSSLKYYRLCLKLPKNSITAFLRHLCVDSSTIGQDRTMLKSSYKPKEIEDEIREFWEKDNVRKKVEESKESSKIAGYVEGPPTLNGDPHIGHLRGRFYKDLWFRFVTLGGIRAVFRGGWDTQGLPVELQAAKELGLTGGKQEIVNFGQEKLVKKAKEMIQKSGQMGVPVIMVGDQIVVGFNRPKLDELLAA